MKIGILTYHAVYNFGASLQTLSTVQYFKNNGFEPIIINWIPEILESRYNQTTPEVQVNAHKDFIKYYLPCSDICRTNQDIVIVVEKYNIQGIVIGSDAVLQHSLFLSRISLTKKGIKIKDKPSPDLIFPNPFWGSFLPLLSKEIPVIIMSASSQNSNFRFIRGNLKKKMQVFLNRFQQITVRDSWTQMMVRYLTNGSIIPSITPDPVFSFNKNVSEQLSKEQIIKKFNLPKKYLLISFRTPNCVTKKWLNDLKTIAEKNNIYCVPLPMKNGIVYDHPFENVIGLPLGPDEWYGLIKYSSGYIGENMHPIIVSLHNCIPFYSFDSYGIIRLKIFVNRKSSKTYDILSKAGFLNNYVNILGKRYKCPSPEEVLFQIKSFDYSKCKSFSLKQQADYDKMMEGIISQFSSFSR